MIGMRLYLAQRISAMILAPLVIGHIALMIYAVQNGLTAAEILGRTKGSFWWALYYGLFVLAVSVHAAIGVRAIAYEWFKLPAGALNITTWAIGVFLTALGLRAVFAVVA